jgi:hypothetical protein
MQRPKAAKKRGYRTPEAERERQREKYARHRNHSIARMRRWYEVNRVERNGQRRAKYAAEREAQNVASR